MWCVSPCRTYRSLVYMAPPSHTAYSFHCMTISHKCTVHSVYYTRKYTNYTLSSLLLTDTLLPHLSPLIFQENLPLRMPSHHDEKGVHDSPGMQREKTQRQERAVLQEEKLQPDNAHRPPARGKKRSLDLLAPSAARTGAQVGGTRGSPGVVGLVLSFRRRRGRFQ